MRLNPDEYCKTQINAAKQYAREVLDGKILVNKWIRLAVERYNRDLENPDYDLRWEEVERGFKFCSLINIKINNKYTQFAPLPYQAFILMNLLLFYYKGTDKRRFRYCFLFQARKNGKSVFAAVLGLYFLVADKELDPQTLVLASTREQASILLDYTKSIVINSKALHKKLVLMQYMIRYQAERSRGVFKVVASNHNRLDGYSPNCGILDEIHSYPDDGLFRVIKSGILARKNPMVILISTAGFNLDSFCYDLVENCKNILNRTISDENFFAMLFTLDEGDDFNDPDTWIKSNPAMGSILRKEDLMIEYTQAKNMPSQLPNFLTKNLNVFVESTQNWIEETALRKCFAKVDENELLGRDCYVGIDLSATRDLTSIVLLFEVNGSFKVIPYFFMAKNESKKFRKGGIDLQPWINKGWITECQTSTIDYDLIMGKLSEVSKKFNLLGVTYDPFNSSLLVPQIEELGITCYKFPQTALNFNFPLKFLEKQIYDENIILGENLVLRWNFRNIALYTDSNGNIKIMKNKSADAVDGSVALAMAFGNYIHDNLDVEGINLNQYLQETSLMETIN